MKLAEQQREKKKTLEQEIEEELCSKKPKNDKEELKKKEELYQKSLNTGRRKTLKSSNVEPLQSSSSKCDTYLERNPSASSSNSIQATVKKSNLDFNLKKEKSISQQSRRDLPPISQVIKRPKDNEKEGGGVLENILNGKATGNLASKIASLSKEQLLELSNAVKKAKKEKVKKSLDHSEYSPRACHSYDEYRPSDFKSRSSSKSTEPVYVPTRIKNQRSQEEYCPVNNYKASEGIKRPPAPSTSQRSKLFDIDTLTPEEIEKIRRERMEKQRGEEAPSKLANDRTKSGSSQMRSTQPSRSFDKPSTYDRASSRHDRPSTSYLPIGANYRRGDYDSSYTTSYGDYEDEDEEDDDEMRDFIDDGDDYETRHEVSKAIQELFPRYNKRKYQFFDDDDDIEESSYAQQMQEERYSHRVGLQEDLEEERRQEEERKRRRRKGIISSDEDD